LVDGKNNIKLTVGWLKSEDGSDWSIRVEGETIDDGDMTILLNTGLSDGGRSATFTGKLNIPSWDGRSW